MMASSFDVFFNGCLLSELLAPYEKNVVSTAWAPTAAPALLEAIGNQLSLGLLCSPAGASSLTTEGQPAPVELTQRQIALVARGFIPAGARSGPAYCWPKYRSVPPDCSQALEPSRNAAHDPGSAKGTRHICQTADNDSGQCDRRPNPEAYEGRSAAVAPGAKPRAVGQSLQESPPSAPNNAGRAPRPWCRTAARASPPRPATLVLRATGRRPTARVGRGHGGSGTSPSHCTVYKHRRTGPLSRLA